MFLISNTANLNGTHGQHHPLEFTPLSLQGFKSSPFHLHPRSFDPVQSLKSEESIEGYWCLEGLKRCEWLILGALLRSWTRAGVLGQHSRVLVQGAVH